MKFEQPDLIGLEVTEKRQNPIKAIDEAQSPASRAKELKRRSAERPASERTRMPKSRRVSTAADWQGRADVGLGAPESEE